MSSGEQSRAESSRAEQTKGTNPVTHYLDKLFGRSTTREAGGEHLPSRVALAPQQRRKKEAGVSHHHSQWNPWASPLTFSSWKQTLVSSTITTNFAEAASTIYKKTRQCVISLISNFPALISFRAKPPSFTTMKMEGGFEDSHNNSHSSSTFSRSRAPPRPFTRLRSGSTSSAPSIAKSIWQKHEHRLSRKRFVSPHCVKNSSQAQNEDTR